MWQILFPMQWKYEDKSNIDEYCFILTPHELVLLTLLNWDLPEPRVTIMKTIKGKRFRKKMGMDLQNKLAPLCGRHAVCIPLKTI